MDLLRKHIRKILKESFDANVKLEENSINTWVVNGIVLIKGAPLENGKQNLYATHALKINEYKPGAKMAILGGDVYKLLVQQGELKAFKIDWSREPSLSKVLKLSPHKSHSVVLNDKKTPYHWESLQYANIRQVIKNLSSVILSVPDLNL